MFMSFFVESEATVAASAIVSWIVQIDEHLGMS